MKPTILEATKIQARIVIPIHRGARDRCLDDLRRRLRGRGPDAPGLGVHAYANPNAGRGAL